MWRVKSICERIEINVRKNNKLIADLRDLQQSGRNFYSALLRQDKMIQERRESNNRLANDRRRLNRRGDGRRATG
ncbi:MAG: hypothetical protein ACJAX5_002517 [Patiriisocius sp.]